MLVIKILNRLMKILNGRVVDLKLREQLRAHEPIRLHRELLHLEYHLLKRVQVVHAHLWRLWDWRGRVYDLLLLDDGLGSLELDLLVLVLHGAHLLALLGDLAGDLLLDALRVLEYLLHGVGRGRPVLLEDLRDVVDARGEVFDVCPLPEGLRSPNQILHVVVLGEVRILQVLVVPQKERGEV